MRDYVAVLVTTDGQQPLSGADGAHEASYTDEGQCAADVVGQCCQTELAPDILNAAREEVPLPHPLLDRAKRVFDALAALIHNFRICCEPYRHPVQNGLVCVSRNLGSIPTKVRNPPQEFLR